MRCHPVHLHCTIFRLWKSFPGTPGHPPLKSAHRLDEGGIQTAGIHIMPYYPKLSTLFSLFFHFIMNFLSFIIKKPQFLAYCETIHR